MRSVCNIDGINRSISVFMDCMLVRGFILDSFATRHRSVHQEVRVKYFASYLIIITI